ncbi:MAG TPA: protein phosphatase 2C domain-containing protein [Pseudonocardia sp.]|jgi:protein phosphatase|nr:protein phosphatase 2C domain-containing protein [Pseudonocardia sp.]
MAPSLTLRYAAHTDQGLVRAENLDAVFAGEGFAAVADGFGQTASSTLVSQRAIEAFMSVTRSPGALLDGLHKAALHAVADVRTLAAPGSDLADAGTTLTALAWSGDELALVHVGDTRAYLLREDGQLLQLTHDDTLVQSLIDSGQLTDEEAESHPQRAILIRALHGGAASAPPTVLPQYAEPGDRYLLCSDGLHSVLTLAQIRRTLRLPQPPQAVVDALITLVREAGAPDNVACVVADVLPT